MSTISRSLSTPAASPHLRPFDVRKDPAGVADLVELCFRDTIDADGERYLKQMRATARNRPIVNWLSFSMELSRMPGGGFVWEQDGRLVGNLSLIPFAGSGYHHYLIANVAVHPDYRGRGIGRALTERAVNYARRRGVPRIWLQVRQDNVPAIHIYSSLGFDERTRRTTWFSQPNSINQPGEKDPGSVRISALAGRDWSPALAWLNQAYPQELRWHFPLAPNTLRPGLWGKIACTSSGIYTRTWAAYQERSLLGLLAWQAMSGQADLLWFSSPPPHENEALKALIGVARSSLNSYRTLNLDYPAGHCQEVLRAAGFREYQTLIWMCLSL